MLAAKLVLAEFFVLAEIFVPAANFVLAEIFVLAGIFVQEANFGPTEMFVLAEIFAGSKFFLAKFFCASSNLCQQQIFCLA